MPDVKARVHTLTVTTSPRRRSSETAVVRLFQLGHLMCVTAQCRCGAKVLPPFPIGDGLSERAVIDAAAMIAGDAQRRCGTGNEAPACRQRRENLAQPVGRNRRRRAATAAPTSDRTAAAVSGLATMLAFDTPLSAAEERELAEGREVQRGGGCVLPRLERIIPVDRGGRPAAAPSHQPK